MARLDDVLIPGLINELAILCIARVPFVYHYNLGAVCRSWRDLFHGKVLSTVRGKLSLAEEWIFDWRVGEDAWRCCDPSKRKFWKLPTMPWKVPRMPHNRMVGCSAVTSLDEKLFVIGGNALGPVNGSSIPCKTVSYFDLRSWCWKRAADLNVARAQCMVRIIENQVYVFGGYTDHGNRTITAETYDHTTDTWKLISNVPYLLSSCHTAVVGRKFYVTTEDNRLKGVLTLYDSQTDKWEDVADELPHDWRGNSSYLFSVYFEIRL